jgi:hypothetical protein
MKKNSTLIISVVLIFILISSIIAGTLPKSEFSKVEITNFNLIYERSRLIGEILNNSAYNLSECELKLSIYKPISGSGSELEKIYNAVSEKYNAGTFADFVQQTHRERFNKLKPKLVECYPVSSEQELLMILDDFFINHTKLMLARKLTVDKEIDSKFSEPFDFDLGLSIYREKHIAIVEIIDLKGEK